MVPISFHATLFSQQAFYNLLPCSPIPTGPYGLKNPSGSPSKFQNLVLSGMVQTSTFQILVILLLSNELFQIDKIVSLIKSPPSNPLRMPSTMRP
jgi:hypothetical protein